MGKEGPQILIKNAIFDGIFGEILRSLLSHQTLTNRDHHSLTKNKDG